jgi:hypothetical protein
VEGTKTLPVPVAAGRGEGQLIAGRYRLASFHRGDERTEVWRALDESGDREVTLEFLRDREPAGRERYVAEARRMAAHASPTAVRVAAIHDDAEATFVVFEHLVEVNVPTNAHGAGVGKALRTIKVTEQPAATTIEPPKAEPLKAEPPKAEALMRPEMPIIVASAPQVPTPIALSESSSDGVLSTLVAGLRARRLSPADIAMLREEADEITAGVRAWIEDLHLEDIRIDLVVAEARALLERVVAEARVLMDRTDMSVLKSAFARASVASRGLASIQPRLHLPAPPRMRIPAPHVSRPPRVRTARVKVPVVKTPAMPRAPRAPRRPLVRVRWGRVLSRGLTLGVLAVVVMSLPPELTAKIENELRSTLAQVSRAVAPSESGLARATFELPPLSAYGAAFESQAPYPTATPNGTVEWVVALRNTGSVGWYRGIDGAQASLALADGTSAGVQSTPFVGPGQVGWFVVHFRAASQPGTYSVSLLPRIDGRGSLPDLGIHATVTVKANP